MYLWPQLLARPPVFLRSIPRRAPALFPDAFLQNQPSFGRLNHPTLSFLDVFARRPATSQLSFLRRRRRREYLPTVIPNTHYNWVSHVCVLAVFTHSKPCTLHEAGHSTWFSKTVRGLDWWNSTVAPLSARISSARLGTQHQDWEKKKDIMTGWTSHCPFLSSSLSFCLRQTQSVHLLPAINLASRKDYWTGYVVFWHPSLLCPQ